MSEAAGDDSVRPAFRVTVRGNLVASIDIVEAPAAAVAPTRLDASTELARNHRENGCLDGEYLFDDPERARSFAVLCLDFVAKLAARDAASIEGADLRDGPGWPRPDG